VEEIASCEAESTLKGGKHHNFIRIVSRKVFTSGMAPLQHGMIREKVVRKELADFTFICDG
jgi:translation elongation factor P/translation initiation factor 5A